MASHRPGDRVHPGSVQCSTRLFAAPEDGVPIGARERIDHRLRAGIGTRGSDKVLRHVDTGLPGMGGLPSTVLLRPPYLGLAGSMHFAGGDQPFSDGSVPLSHGLRVFRGVNRRRNVAVSRRPNCRRSSRSRSPRQAPRRTRRLSDRPFPFWPVRARHPVNRRDRCSTSFAIRRRPRPVSLGDPRRSLGSRCVVTRVIHWPWTENHRTKLNWALRRP